MAFTVNNVQFPVYLFLNGLFSFLIVAAIVYFFVVTPINALIARQRRSQQPADPTTKKCTECLSEIPIGATRCAFCTQLQAA